jgi:hypothetical protein
MSNINSFDFVFNLPSGLKAGASSITHSITILPSIMLSRKKKIKRVFNI